MIILHLHNCRQLRHGVRNTNILFVLNCHAPESLRSLYCFMYETIWMCGFNVGVDELLKGLRTSEELMESVEAHTYERTYTVILYMAVSSVWRYCASLQSREQSERTIWSLSKQEGASHQKSALSASLPLSRPSANIHVERFSTETSLPRYENPRKISHEPNHAHAS